MSAVVVALTLLIIFGLVLTVGGWFETVSAVPFWNVGRTKRRAELPVLTLAAPVWSIHFEHLFPSLALIPAVAE